MSQGKNVSNTVFTFLRIFGNFLSSSYLICIAADTDVLVTNLQVPPRKLAENSNKYYFSNMFSP
jgi:hypothetical protein